MTTLADLAARLAAHGINHAIVGEIAALDFGAATDVQSLIAIGDALRAVNLLDLAARCYARARALAPHMPVLLFIEAEVAMLQGRTEEARAMFASVSSSAAEPAFREIARLKAACILPPVMTSAARAAAQRARIAKALAIDPPLTVPDAYLAFGFPNFYLAYQAEDDRPLQEALARYYLRFSPKLAVRARHVDAPRAPGRIRVGMVSRHFYNHTIGYLNEGLIKGLDRDRFELVLFRIPSGYTADDMATDLAAAAARVFDLPHDLRSAHALVAGQQLDVLHFPDIGMDYFGYFLAFGRLARVQTVGWGHPVTTGVPNLDGFLSVDAMEPAGGEAHYSERLVRFSAAVPTVAPAKVTAVRPDRAAFGIAVEGPVYLCPQSLFKVHPTYDRLVARILARDPHAVIHFLAQGEAPDRLFLQRVAAALGPSAARVRLIPRVTPAKFPELLACADVILDVPEWSGGKTSLEAFAAGLPVVHRPGRFMRGRHTLAFYRQMGLENYVAKDDDDYAALAVRLARDGGFRAQMCGDIAANAARLFDQPGALRETEAWWLQALN